MELLMNDSQNCKNNNGRSFFNGNPFGKKLMIGDKINRKILFICNLFFNIYFELYSI